VEEVLWPETLNPDSIRSIRALKARVEDTADSLDLKRGPGGIRDIEFAVQMLQLVHGRFDPELRSTNTLELIDALVEGGYVAADDASHLAKAYRWLRAAEHRVQLWDLRQTHLLPTATEDRDRLARAMGYRDDPERTARAAFEADLVNYRSSVRRIHENLYFRPLLEAFAATPATGLSREGAERRLVALGFRDIPAAIRTFETLTAGLSRRSRLMQQMLPLILDWLADSPDPDLGLDQLRLVAARLPDHAEMITTLHDRPQVGERLCYLLGSSRLLGEYLDRIPEFVPRLGDDRTLTELRPRPALEVRLRQRLDARPDPDDKVGTLRRFSRRHFLRVAARDLLGLSDVDRTMSDLSAGADAAVSAAASVAGAEHAFAIIAMGRWGGSELSYGSDLDLMYVHTDPLTTAEALSRAQELRHLLATPARDGIAWELDANLRPEGRSGPLVRSLNSYRAYYERWAETWEFQALVKARPVAGDPALGGDFIQMLEPFVWRDPFPAEAVVAVRQMKARVEKQRIPAGEDPDFHLKLGPGGLVDIEFLVQLLQLRHGAAHRELRTPSTLVAIERLAEVEALSSVQARDLAAAYRFCTGVRNRLYLQMGRRIDSLPTEPAEEWRLAVSLGYQRRGDLREDYRRVTRRARRIFEDEFYR
jgi:[glutamine synthetase] adenylyltransferase / [glutamine synthetase]-adenylyl-L-tyrosine phosphorylase